MQSRGTTHRMRSWGAVTGATCQARCSHTRAVARMAAVPTTPLSGEHRTLRARVRQVECASRGAMQVEHVHGEHAAQRVALQAEHTPRQQEGALRVEST